MNKLPNFICVGAQKAGTTTLHDILKQHPDIFLPEIKETKFFADHDKYEKGIKFYKSEFYSNIQDEKIVGEVDPEYMYFDYVPARIKDTLGENVKLIFMLRNPASRAFSHYLMSLRRGYETLSFEDAIKVESERIKEDDTDKKWLSQRSNLSYIDRGYYAKQIKHYLKFFPIENMHFILFEEEFLKNKEETLEGVYQYLGIKSNKNIELNLKSNVASEPKSILIRDLFNSKSNIKELIKLFIPTKARKLFRSKIQDINLKPSSQRLDLVLKRKLIKKYYMSDIKELEKLINKDLSSWIDG